MSLAAVITVGLPVSLAAVISVGLSVSLPTRERCVTRLNTVAGETKTEIEKSAEIDGIIL